MLKDTTMALTENDLAFVRPRQITVTFAPKLIAMAVRVAMPEIVLAVIATGKMWGGKSSWGCSSKLLDECFY